MIKLKREVNINETGQCEKGGQNNPARKRSRIDLVPVSSARSTHAIFSATRNFALRERGLFRRSFSPGSIGFEVIARKSCSGLRCGSGHSGRSSHSRL